MDSSSHAPVVSALYIIPNPLDVPDVSKSLASGGTLADVLGTHAIRVPLNDSLVNINVRYSYRDVSWSGAITLVDPNNALEAISILIPVFAGVLFHFSDANTPKSQWRWRLGSVTKRQYKLTPAGMQMTLQVVSYGFQSTDLASRLPNGRPDETQLSADVQIGSARNALVRSANKTSGIHIHVSRFERIVRSQSDGADTAEIVKDIQESGNGDTNALVCTPSTMIKFLARISRGSLKLAPGGVETTRREYPPNAVFYIATGQSIVDFIRKALLPYSFNEHGDQYRMYFDDAGFLYFHTERWDKRNGKYRDAQSGGIVAADLVYGAGGNIVSAEIDDDAYRTLMDGTTVSFTGIDPKTGSESSASGTALDVAQLATAGYQRSSQTDEIVLNPIIPEDSAYRVLGVNPYTGKPIPTVRENVQAGRDLPSLFCEVSRRWAALRNNYMRVTLTINGPYDLDPWAFIRFTYLRANGKPHFISGTYMVGEVEHNYGPDGCRVTLTAGRYGVSKSQADESAVKMERAYDAVARITSQPDTVARIGLDSGALTVVPVQDYDKKVNTMPSYKVTAAAKGTLLPGEIRNADYTSGL
jgi:hypothetical protein